MKPVLALFAVLSLTACSAAPAPAVTVTTTAVATSSPTPEPSVNGWESAQAFAGAALKGDYDEAEQYVAQRSAAEHYLTHMKAVEEAQSAAGSGGNSSPDDVTYDADSGTVTYTYSDPDMTFEWNRFEYDAAGKVISWATGKSDTKLSDRLWSKPAKASTSHATVQLVSAYKNDSGLWIVLDVKAKDRSISPDCSALLDDAKHRQREAASCDAPEKIVKGNSAYVALVFDKADFGGTLRYQVQDSNYNEFGTVKIKIK